MTLCPSGHESQTFDYCDVCGALIGGAPPEPEPGPAAAGGGPPGRCPQCGARRDGRFCEECGYDYELAALVPPGSAVPAPPAGDPLAETGELDPDFDLDAAMAAAEREAAAPAGPGAGTGAGLTAVVTADLEYYTAQLDRGDIDQADFPFPKYAGERTFAFSTDRVRIGRASAGRGIVVEVDLTGPPLDPAVSHLHAQLLRKPDGSWVLVDLNSANGTRVNGSAQPVPAETEIPVCAGDRIHVGVWTTLLLV